MRADKEIYRYLQGKGYELLDDVSAYNGVNGLFRHTGTDGKDYIKVGYHEGLVDSETWLAVQDKKAHNSKFGNNLKAKNVHTADMLSISLQAGTKAILSAGVITLTLAITVRMAVQSQG